MCNVPLNTRFYELDESLVSAESYGYKITISLAEAYLLNGKVDESINLLEDLLSKINFGVLEVYGTNDFRDSVAMSINSLAVSLNNAGKYDMAGCLYKQAYKLALTEDALLLVGIIL